MSWAFEKQTAFAMQSSLNTIYGHLKRMIGRKHEAGEATLYGSPDSVIAEKCSILQQWSSSMTVISS